MAELTVTLNGNPYPVYADTDFADQYLAGDLSRWPVWDGLTTEVQGRALVSATRLLQRQSWKDGVPVMDGPPLVVQQAAALLAADIAQKPVLADDASTASNIKAVGAGSARVEFFAPVQGQRLPPAAFALLRGLLSSGQPVSDPALDNSAYGSNDYQNSRFDPTDYGRYPDNNRAVDRDEPGWWW